MNVLYDANKSAEVYGIDVRKMKSDEFMFVNYIQKSFVCKIYKLKTIPYKRLVYLIRKYQNKGIIDVQAKNAEIFVQFTPRIGYFFSDCVNRYYKKQLTQEQENFYMNRFMRVN